MINLRPISWLKGARREFEDFPTDVRIEADIALTLATRGGKADTAKPIKGVDGIYAVQLGVDLWVIDAFQKKSKTGIKTPQMDVDRIRQRIKRLKEALNE
jgi:phage-related protein